MSCKVQPNIARVLAFWLEQIRVPEQGLYRSHQGHSCFFRRRTNLHLCVLMIEITVVRLWAYSGFFSRREGMDLGEGRKEEDNGRTVLFFSSARTKWKERDH